MQSNRVQRCVDGPSVSQSPSKCSFEGFLAVGLPSHRPPFPFYVDQATVPEIFLYLSSNPQSPVPPLNSPQCQPPWVHVVKSRVSTGQQAALGLDSAGHVLDASLVFVICQMGRLVATVLSNRPCWGCSEDVKRRPEGSVWVT